MQFTSPTVLPSPLVVQTDPTSTIAVVSTSVPFLNRDAFFWPGLSGESFPPSRTAGSTYNGWSSIVNSPYVAAQQSGGAAGSVTFPALPRIGYNGKTVMTFETNVWTLGTAFPVAAGTEQFAAIIGYDLNAWRVGFVYKGNGAAAPNGWSLYARMGNNPDTLLVANEPLNRPRLLRIVLQANGDVEWWLDGVLVQQQAGFWPTVFNPMASPAWQLQAVANAVGSIAAARTSVKWT